MVDAKMSNAIHPPFENGGSLAAFPIEYKPDIEIVREEPIQKRKVPKKKKREVVFVREVKREKIKGDITKSNNSASPFDQFDFKV